MAKKKKKTEAQELPPPPQEQLVQEVSEVKIELPGPPEPPGPPETKEPETIKPPEFIPSVDLTQPPIPTELPPPPTPQPPLQPVFSVEEARRNGEDLGEALILVCEVVSGESIKTEQCEKIKKSVGNIAYRHPQWFSDSNIADAVDVSVIVVGLSPCFIKAYNNLKAKLQGLIKK